MNLWTKLDFIANWCGNSICTDYWDLTVNYLRSHSKRYSVEKRKERNQCEMILVKEQRVILIFIDMYCIWFLTFSSMWFFVVKAISSKISPCFPHHSAYYCVLSTSLLPKEVEDIKSQIEKCVFNKLHYFSFVE